MKTLFILAFLLLPFSTKITPKPQYFKTWEQCVDSVKAIVKATPLVEDSIMLSLVEYIKEHEGFRAKPYICTGGQLTIGYGTSVRNYKYFMEDYTGEVSKKNAELAVKKILQYCYDNIESRVTTNTSDGEIWAMAHLAYCAGTNHSILDQLIKVHNEDNGKTVGFIKENWLKFGDENMRLIEVGMYMYYKFKRKYHHSSPTTKDQRLDGMHTLFIRHLKLQDSNATTRADTAKKYYYPIFN